MGTHWIADPTGVHALVDGDEQRNLWVGHYGWHDSAEPKPTDQVRIVLGEMKGCIPFAALAGGWDELGWTVGPPPEPVDPTKDSALAGQPAVVPAKQTKAAAGGGGKSEEK